jgi:hypothetical protein
MLDVLQVVAGRCGGHSRYSLVSSGRPQA